MRLGIDLHLELIYKLCVCMSRFPCLALCLPLYASACLFLSLSVSLGLCLCRVMYLKC